MALLLKVWIDMVCGCKYHYSRILASEPASSNADIQFLEIGTLSQMKQNTKWDKSIGPEKQRGRLRSYIANIAVNLWGHDLLQQWNIQINIPAAQKLMVLRKILEILQMTDTSHSGCTRTQSN